MLQIQENPYLQYFVGLSSYKDEPPFTASLFVEIRKRMGRKVFSSFEETILSSIESKRRRKISKQPGFSDTPENHGKMVVDATVAEQAIRYSTDISLLKEAREISEQLIDELYAISSLTKKRNSGGKLRRKAIREQLNYWTIQDLYDQQYRMYKEKRRRCDDHTSVFLSRMFVLLFAAKQAIRWSFGDQSN